MKQLPLTADDLPFAYEELRSIARSLMSIQSTSHTLTPTALVHEAYLKLVRGKDVKWESYRHLLSACSRVMRHILVDHARRKKSRLHGGHLERRLFVDTEDVAKEVIWVELCELLDQLRELDSRQSEIVHLHYFLRLTTNEIAELLGISMRTVQLELRMARAWIRKEWGGE